MKPDYIKFFRSYSGSYFIKIRYRWSQKFFKIKSLEG